MVHPSTSTHDLSTMDNLFQILTTSNSVHALAHTLRGMHKDTQDHVWASPLGSGQDPLDILDVRGNTLGVLYILSARLTLNGAPMPPWGVVEDFCAHFDPEQARAAPDRVLQLAKGIQKAAYDSNSPHTAIPLLHALVTRFPPSPTILTPIHPILLHIALSTRHIAPILPLLSPNPISELSPYNDLTPTDVLTYFYTAGMILGTVERWEEAEDMMEYVLVHPGYPGAIQFEAMKKHRLFGLICRGKPAPLPKPTHPLLLRLFKATPYNALLSSYPSPTQTQTLLETHTHLFTQEKNLGLVKRAVGMARVWSIKKLTGTYVTLSLEDIAKEVGGDAEDVRGVVLGMIENGTLHAHFTAPTTVYFTDPPPGFTMKDVDRVLRDVQAQAEGMRGVDEEMGRGREFLGKVVKQQESGWLGGSGAGGGGGGVPTEEEVFAMAGGMGSAWDEYAL